MERHLVGSANKEGRENPGLLYTFLLYEALAGPRGKIRKKLGRIVYTLTLYKSDLAIIRLRAIIAPGYAPETNYLLSLPIEKLIESGPSRAYSAARPLLVTLPY